jgi:ribosomal protein S18 acetylase RimI-like enzyme
MTVPDPHALLAERVDAEHLAAAYGTASLAVRHAAGVQVRRIGGAVVAIAARVDVLSFNRAVGLGMAEPASEGQIDEITDTYRAAGAPRFFIQVSPAARPAGILDWLTARGFVHHNNWMKLWRDAGPPPKAETELAVIRIGEERAGDWAGIVAAAFEFPTPLQDWLAEGVGRGDVLHYLALDGDRPVGAASVFLAGEVGHLSWAATLPEARGRGAQSALIATRLRDGILRGCRWFVSETAEDLPEKPNPSTHNLRRMGFELLYLRPNYRLSLTP